MPQGEDFKTVVDVPEDYAVPRARVKNSQGASSIRLHEAAPSLPA
jgi:hypothetical protein